MNRKISNIAASSTARKVVGSLGVIGAAAAVAGLGTFGTFTDSSTPVATTISSGTLNIDVAQQGFAVPATTANFVPGDTMTRAVNLINSGSSALGSVTLNTTAAASDVLTSDVTNGLQLAIKSCGVAWTQGGTAAAPTYTCASGERLLGSGPVLRSMALTNLASVAPGATDYLTFEIALPPAADNAFQGKTAALSLVFTGTQRTGTTR